VDLSEKSARNMAFMVQEITFKLKMGNVAALQASQFSLDRYDDLLDLYKMDEEKYVSPNEMQAIVEELGSLKKHNLMKGLAQMLWTALFLAKNFKCHGLNISSKMGSFHIFKDRFRLCLQPKWVLAPF